MNRNSKEIIYKIQEFSFWLFLTRIIAVGVSIYFILNFNNDPSFNAFILLFLGFVILIATHKRSITATKLGIETKQFNLLNVFTKKKCTIIWFNIRTVHSILIFMLKIVQ